MYETFTSYRQRVATIELWQNGILFIKIDDNCEVELEDSKAQFEIIKGHFNGKNKLRVYVEPGRYTTISKEARRFSSLPQNNSMTLATAVLVKTLAHRIIINFLINVIRQQKMKMRMFDSRDKAVEWLLSLEA